MTHVYVNDAGSQQSVLEKMYEETKLFAKNKDTHVCIIYV